MVSNPLVLNVSGSFTQNNSFPLTDSDSGTDIITITDKLAPSPPTEVLHPLPLTEWLSRSSWINVNK